jgi:hypothetical protein
MKLILENEEVRNACNILFRSLKGRNYMIDLGKIEG